MDVVFREIRPEDNESIKNIIRTVLEEFDGAKPGTAYNDKETFHMYESYQKEKSMYLVVLIDGKIVGGVGIQGIEGTDFEICEAQKLYFLPEARGLGIGRMLFDKILDIAKEFGYKRCYLETFENMDKAISLYKKLGFSQIDYRLATTGHDACPVWMLKEL